MKCQFFECDEEAVGKPWGEKSTGKVFCKAHDDECRKAWQTSAPVILAFWIRAGGGVRRMADSM